MIDQTILRPESYREMETEVQLANGVGSRYGLGVGLSLADGRRLIAHGGEVSGFTAQNDVYPDGRAINIADGILRARYRESLSAPALLATGAVPAGRRARAADRGLANSGGVAVDACLQSAAPGIYAAGDMAEYDSVIHGRRLRVEHWDVAFNQGKAAALNMLGHEQPYEVIPYFFSDVSDWVSLEYVGPASRWDQEIVRGSLDDGQFTVFYLIGSQVAAALSIGRSDDLEHARRLIASGADVSGRVQELRDVASELASV